MATLDPIELLLHREAMPGRGTRRLFLSARVFNVTGDADYCPRPFHAVIDTGAAISIVPQSVVQHFGTDRMIKGPAMTLLGFDGAPSPNESRSYRVHFELGGLEPNRTRAHKKTVHTRDLWDDPLLCCGVAMVQKNPDGEAREHVILGMDFLDRCRLDLDGPSAGHRLVLYPNRSRHT